MNISAETIALIAAAAPTVGALLVIAHRLGMIHADFRRLVDLIKDHETRIRALEKGEAS